MKAIDRRAAEFRWLQEAVNVRLNGLDLSDMADLSLDLSVQEYRSLEFLASIEPRKTKELAEYLGLAMNSVTTVVDGLETKQLAKRRRDDPDRRVIRVELTKKGRQAAEAVARGRLQIYRTFLSALTAEEQETLLAIYRKIASVGKVLNAG